MRQKVIPLRRVDGVPSEMSDEALLVACATGESAALGALFDRHHDAIRRYLARLSGTDDRDLEDLVMATFEALPRAARGFAGRAAVKTWLLGVAGNVARHHVRAELRRRRLSEAVAATRSQTADATDDVLAQERAAALGRAIATLPAKLRETFVLVYLEGIAGAEVAELLGVREGTVWNRLHEARALLRGALEGVRP